MMDTKTSALLNLTKSGGYASTLWTTVGHWGVGVDGPLIVLILTADSVRNYLMRDRAPPVSPPCCEYSYC